MTDGSFTLNRHKAAPGINEGFERELALDAAEQLEAENKQNWLEPIAASFIKHQNIADFVGGQG